MAANDSTNNSAADTTAADASAGIASLTRNAFLAPSKSGQSPLFWIAGVLFIATISYFWTKILSDVFDANGA